MASKPSLATLRLCHNRSQPSASLVRRTSAGLSSISRISTGPYSTALVSCWVMLGRLPVVPSQAYPLTRKALDRVAPCPRTGSSGAQRVVATADGAQHRNVANRHGFTAGPYHAERFPRGEQPAHDKQRRAGHLGQLFAREADFDGTVDAPANLCLQSQELAGDPRANLLGCH